MKFVAGNYYEHRCLLISPLVFTTGDVAYDKPLQHFMLQDRQLVFCEQILWRVGDSGIGLYAKLLHRNGVYQLTLFLRVSKQHIGSGTWRKLQPLEVLALADDLPVVNT